MTQEDKELLLKDLCARLPFGVKANVWEYQYAETLAGLDVNKQTFNLEHSIGEQIFSRHDDLIIKPYLRPMSSMTQAEKSTYSNYRRVVRGLGLMFEYNLDSTTEWLLEHHFDYRGLIEKGLAFEAPEGMYNIKYNIK